MGAAAKETGIVMMDGVRGDGVFVGRGRRMKGAYLTMEHCGGQ